MISTNAASTLDRATVTFASSATRRIATAAASTWPWARRSIARPGCGSRPHWPACRYAVLGLGELAAEPVHLGLLVERHPDRRSASKPLARPIRLVRRLPPRAVKQHDLGSMHQALAPVRHQAGLRLAPTGQRRRPLPGPAHVEDLLARLDHRAIDEPGEDRRHLAGRHRDHHLIEQGHPIRRFSHADQSPALAHPAVNRQVLVAEADADTRRPLERGMGSRWILVKGLNRDGQEQIPPLHTVVVHLVEQPLGSGEPSAAPCHLAPQQKSLGEPARAPGGSHHIPQPQALVMGTEPSVVAVDVRADQVRRHRQPLQILQSERPLPIRGRQLGERIPPRVSPEELPATIQQIGHGHSLPQHDSPLPRAHQRTPPVRNPRTRPNGSKTAQCPIPTLDNSGPRVRVRRYFRATERLDRGLVHAAARAAVRR